MHIHHLQSAHFFKDAAWCQSLGVAAEALPQSDMQAVGKECNEDVRFDAILVLMMDWAQGQIAFKIFSFFKKIRGLISVQAIHQVYDKELFPVHRRSYNHRLFW